MLEFIDVSNWQGPINWSQVFNSHFISAAIAKATEGVGYTDPQWGNNQGQLLSQTGVIGGSYHYARPDLGNSAINEADWYLSRHSPQCFQANTAWIFSLDAESAGGNAGWVDAFLGRVKARIGYAPWFYSYQDWIISRAIKEYGYPLWIAAPSSPHGQPPTLGWPVATAQQYGTRNVPGINGGVDADVFLGGQEALNALAGIGASVPKSTTGGSMILYVPNTADVMQVVIGADVSHSFFWRRGNDQYIQNVDWTEFGSVPGGFAPGTACVSIKSPNADFMTLEAHGLDGKIYTSVRSIDGKTVLSQWAANKGVASIAQGTPGPPYDDSAIKAQLAAYQATLDKIKAALA